MLSASFGVFVVVVGVVVFVADGLAAGLSVSSGVVALRSLAFFMLLLTIEHEISLLR